MIDTYERMDDSHEKAINDAVRRLIKFLNEDAPRSCIYSHINVCLNILTGGIVTIAYNFIEEENEEIFIKNIIEALRMNLEENRKNKPAGKV